MNGDQIRQREGSNIFGYIPNSRIESNLKVHGICNRYMEPVSDTIKPENRELSHTIDRNTVLVYSQLGDIRETNAFAYADQASKRDRWRFNIGARVDHFNFHYLDKLKTNSRPITENNNKPQAEYSIYTQYKSFQLYLKTGKGFHSNDARVVVFNRGYDILPAAWGADLGMLLKPTRNLLVNVAAWYLYLQQEFVYVGDEGVVEPSGKTRRIGLDVSARYQFNKWLFADANINLAKPRSTEDPKGENNIPLAPTFTSTGGLNWQLKNGLNGSLRYRHMHDRAANEDNSVVAKGYTVTDFALNYTRKKYEIGVAVENLFNVKWNETSSIPNHG